MKIYTKMSQLMTHFERTRKIFKLSLLYCFAIVLYLDLNNAMKLTFELFIQQYNKSIKTEKSNINES